MHGVRDSGQREHIVYPTWSRDRSCGAWGCDEPGCKGGFHGPDPYCDWSGCEICMHNCDCDVCQGLVSAPGLMVFVDSHEGETPQKIKARKEREHMDIAHKLKEIAVGDYVIATGVDTRGHAVTRKGTLLAEPKPGVFQSWGKRKKGWRVCVGLDGTDPALRSTWVTLYPDKGSVEPAAEPSGWTKGKLGDVPGVRATNPTVRVVFGGKGGKRSQEPGPARVAVVTYVGEGRYEVRDQQTQEVLLNCTLQTSVWWAPARLAEELAAGTSPAERDVPPPGGQADAASQSSAAAPEPAGTTACRPQRGVLYEGWLATDGSLAVLALDTGRVIGWLTLDHERFIPADV